MVKRSMAEDIVGSRKQAGHRAKILGRFNKAIQHELIKQLGIEGIRPSPEQEERTKRDQGSGQESFSSNREMECEFRTKNEAALNCLGLYIEKEKQKRYYPVDVSMPCKEEQTNCIPGMLMEMKLLIYFQAHPHWLQISTHSWL